MVEKYFPSKKSCYLRNRLSYYRKLRFLTQAQLASVVGCSQNTISSIESGVFVPSSYLAFLLCKALNVQFEDLFYWEGSDGR